MAHSWPEGQDARLRDFERRLSIADTDVKRLWKGLPSGGRVLNPGFDGESTPSTGGNILISWTSTTQYPRTIIKSIYDAQLSGSEWSVDAVNLTIDPPKTLDQYSLIVMFGISPWANDIGPWLTASNQRRFLFYQGVTSSSFLGDIGSSLEFNTGAFFQSIDSGSDPPPPYGFPVTSSGHYLSSGLSLQIDRVNYFRTSGGTVIFEIISTLGGPVARIETLSSGAEIILFGSGYPIAGNAGYADNTTFLQRLYPDVSLGGVPIP